MFSPSFLESEKQKVYFLSAASSSILGVGPCDGYAAWISIYNL